MRQSREVPLSGVNSQYFLTASPPDVNSCTYRPVTQRREGSSLALRREVSHMSGETRTHSTNCQRAAEARKGRRTRCRLGLLAQRREVSVGGGSQRGSPGGGGQ